MNEGHDTTYGNSAIGRPDDKNAPAPPVPCPYCGGKVAHTDKCPLVTADPGPEEAAEAKARLHLDEPCTECGHPAIDHGWPAGVCTKELNGLDQAQFCECQRYAPQQSRESLIRTAMANQDAAFEARQKPDFAEIYGRAAYAAASVRCAACGHVSALHAPNGGRCTGKYCPCKAYLPFGTGLQPPVEVAQARPCATCGHHMGSHRGHGGGCVQGLRMPYSGAEEAGWCACAKYEPGLYIAPTTAQVADESVAASEAERLYLPTEYSAGPVRDFMEHRSKQPAEPAVDELWAVTPTEHLSQDLRAAQRHLRATYSADQVTALRIAAYLIDLGWQPPQGTTA